MEIASRLLSAGRGGRPGRPITPKAVVLHWTANTDPGADAAAHRSYFENHPQNRVSAHYVVDDREIIQCIPEEEMAYHVGARRYTQRALRELSPYPNDCTIGVEMCVNADGDFTRTYQHATALVAGILERRGWETDRLWRHYDITGKDCPRFWVDDITARRYGFESAAAGWKGFREDVAVLLAAGEVVGVFEDIAGHWAAGEVERAAERGIVKGDPDGWFRPNAPATRAEVVAMVNRAVDYILEQVLGQTT